MSWFSVSADKYGTLGDWIAGAATVAAVVIALRESALAQTRERMDRLCAVTAWMQLERRVDGSPRWTVFVSNETKHPIYDWLVIPHTPDGVAEWHLCASRLGPLVPGPTKYEVGVKSADFQAATPVEMQFEDRDGQRWMRTARGQLEPLAEVRLDDGRSSCSVCS